MLVFQPSAKTKIKTCMLCFPDVHRIHVEVRRTQTDLSGSPSDPYGCIWRSIGPILIHTDLYRCPSDPYRSVRMSARPIWIHTQVRRSHTDPYGGSSETYCSIQRPVGPRWIHMEVCRTHTDPCGPVWMSVDRQAPPIARQALDTNRQVPNF